MLRIIRTLEEFKTLESRWNYLTEDCGEGNIHTTFTWLYVWWETYELHRFSFNFKYELFLIFYEDEHNLCWGVAPFMLESREDKIICCFIGEGVSDYADFLIYGDRVKFFTEIIEFLIKERIMFVRLSQFSEESPNYKPLLQVLNERNIVFNNTEKDICPYLRINGDWSAYYSTICKSQRYNIARYEKRINSLGILKFRRLVEVNTAILECFAEVNKKRQDSLNRPSLYDDVFKRNFVFTVNNYLSKMGMVEAAYFELNGKIIAYIYGFVSGKKYFYWNLSFDPSFNKYSPGKILLKNLLMSHYKDRYAEFDFMRGNEPYKFIWTKTSRSNRIIEFVLN